MCNARMTVFLLTPRTVAKSTTGGSPWLRLTFRDVGTPERSAVLSKLDEMLSYASRFGYRPEDVVEMIQAKA